MRAGPRRGGSWISRACGWSGCTWPAAGSPGPSPRWPCAGSCCGPRSTGTGAWAARTVAQQLALVLEAGAASVIAVAAQSPFGDPERATGRWLPYLRLGTAVGLTVAAFGALAAGAAAEPLPGGTLDILRNTAGLTGIGLLLAAVTGGALAWAGPMMYMIVAQFALIGDWPTPWMWPARPPHDVGAALCAGLVFTAGIVVATVRGARAARDI